jgi:hypothetical protein
MMNSMVEILLLLNFLHFSIDNDVSFLYNAAQHDQNLDIENIVFVEMNFCHNHVLNDHDDDICN